MLIYGHKTPHKSSKIHWSSTDGYVSVQKATTPSPILLPDQKPNPNKQVHHKISNIDIHKYLGFRTLKTIKPFQLVAQDAVSFINAGEIPLTHGDFTTIQKHRSNKSPVPRPKHFFNVAHTSTEL